MLLRINEATDTLNLNVHGEVSEERADELERLKRGAQEGEDVLATPWSFLGQTLFIRPNGGGRQWRWVLFCGDHYLHLDIGLGKLNGICCKVRCSSLLLHERGTDGALNAVYRFLVDWLGEEKFFLQVSEADLCVDIAGWELTGADAERFISKGALHELPDEDIPAIPEIDRRGRKVRAFTFSKTAPHSCAIYDKSHEVKVHHKEWFYEIWKANGWDEVCPVTRVEFRYERSCLKEMGIEEPYAMLDLLGGMWGYSSQIWLRHVTPDGGRNQSRWPVSDVWQVVQGATFNTDPTPLVREKKYSLDAERAMQGFVGYATGWATRARLSLAAVQEDGGGFLGWAYDPMRDYLVEQKARTFTDIMREKADRLGLPVEE